MPGPPTGPLYRCVVPGMYMSYSATPARSHSNPVAVIVTSVPPMYGPVELSRTHFSTTFFGFRPA